MVHVWVPKFNRNILIQRYFFMKIWGLIFEKSYDKLMKEITKKPDLQKNSDEHVVIKKSYEKLRTKLCKTYEKLTTLQVSYENATFATSDVIRETLCQRLLLVKYFELKN